MHEYSNQIKSTWPIYWTNKFFKRKIFVYHHGHAIDMDKVVNAPIIYAEKTIALVFHDHSKRYFYDLGFINQYIIGYPKFYSEWTELIEEYVSNKSTKEEIALIFSRHVHPFYMDEDKYIKLLSSSYRIIREKLNDIPIVIKPHPRESTSLIKKVLSENNTFNCYISKEHPAILSESAKFSISFWGSVILDTLSAGIPAVEYYIEADRFREAEPEGSAYKKLGIQSVENELDLQEFLDSVINGKYTHPSVIEDLAAKKDVSFLYQ